MGSTERNGQDGSLRIAGRYRLIEKLGAGGMSVVWRGYDEILGRDVAVKVLSPQLAEDRTFRDRLRQEALAAARLCHPHITGVYDFGEAPISDRLTVPYVVMELNDGESLGARLGRQGALEWREAVMISAEIASALATAHARGVVHRDVTPANVMLTGAGAKVVDFGISAVVGQRDAAPDGSLLGTPAYLAPERLGGASVSPATDVYALGLLLYRALTGRMPWPAENTAEALRAHLYSCPEPIADVPGMPVGVAEMCLRCLAKAPMDRPSAADVARALAATIGLRPIIPPLRPDENPVALSARGVVSVVAPRPSRRGVAASPADVPRRAKVAELRLRAGLKIGSALRMGVVRPLGGGLFMGGRAVPDREFAGRRDRMPAVAALATMVLLSATVLSWSARREAQDAGAAHTTAAGAGVPAVGGPAAGAMRRGRCSVRYEVRRDSGADFEARLTVVSTSAKESRWQVEFRYPGTQRLATGPKAVTQQGRQVMVNGQGGSQVITLHGDYRDRNPLPLAFALDGRPCRVEILGSTNPGTVKNNSVSATAGEASPRGGTERKRKRAQPRKQDTGRKPAARQAPAQPAPVAPVPKRTPGFSLAL